MSSSATSNLNLPASISRSMARKPLPIRAASAREINLTFASMLACAIEPRMSWRNSRRSNGSDAVNASTSGRRPLAKRPRRMLPDAAFAARFVRGVIRNGSSFDQVHRVAEVDMAVTLDRRERAEVRLMPLHRGAKNREVARQVLLRMRGHHASEGGLNRGYLHAVADFEHAADPFIFDEAAGVAAGVDQHVGAKAAIVEIRFALGQSAHVRESSGRNQMKARGIEIAAFVEGKKVGHRVGAEGRDDVGDRIVGKDGCGIEAGALPARIG